MIDRKIKKVKILFIIICITQLFYLFHYRSGFNYSVFKDPFSQDSGNAYAVSEEVIESNNLLKKNKISKFNLSENLQRDKYFHQRFVEFNYPIRLDNSSKFIFFLNNEPVPNYCKTLDTLKKIKLTKC